MGVVVLHCDANQVLRLLALDGIAGGCVVRVEVVHEHLLVTEDEIAGAMVWAQRELNVLVEGGGAVGLAGALSGRLDPVDGDTVIVVSGGNVSLETLNGLAAAR